MSLSDDERRLLAEMARHLEEQDPDFVWALRGPAKPAAPQVAWPRRVVARWRLQFHQSERAPLRIALAGGLLFFGGLFLAANLTDAPAPAPGAEAQLPIFAEQDLHPEPAAPAMFRIGP